MIAKRRRRSDEVRGEALNMTPMIDVVFQLLIFFMLSMHFREVEGKLLSQLPKKGPDSAPHPETELLEVRIVLCSGDPLAHLRDKTAHLAAAGDGEVCAAHVEQVRIGDLRRTETHPPALALNKGVYRETGVRAREMRDRLPAHPVHGKPPIILDADRQVPYEHVIGVVNALQEAGITRIEFAADPGKPLR